jgi:thioredoxin reductase (NADPH)
MAIMEKQATSFGSEIKVEKVKGVRKEGNAFKVITDKKEYPCKTVIIATGVERRSLEVPGEKEFQNKGVSFCATCDGALFKNKTVAVVGGSDNMKRINEKIKDNKIEIINKTNITEIKGNKVMTHVILDKEHKGSKELKLDGVFIEIGGTPGSALAQGLGVKTDEKGYIIIDRQSKTNVPGVFAAGDVTSNVWKQGIIAASEGSYAAFSAFEYLKSKEK